MNFSQIYYKLSETKSNTRRLPTYIELYEKKNNELYDYYDLNIKCKIFAISYRFGV